LGGYGEREGWYNKDEIKGDYVCAVMEVPVGQIKVLELFFRFQKGIIILMEVSDYAHFDFLL
jgi:hypothetical protein